MEQINFFLCENGFDFSDKNVWIYTCIDTTIGIGACGFAVGTASLTTAEIALPGVLVVGGLIVLCIGFDYLIRAITGYWE